MTHKIALIGFGTVGQGLCEILLEKRDFLKETYGFEWDIVAISDPVKGSLYCPDGLHIERMLELAKAGQSIEEGSCNCEKQQCQQGWDALKTIRESNADTVCELAFTDLKTAEPATGHCKAAFETGKHLVTSNKGPAALNYRELKKLADANDVEFKIEGTVMAGTPVLNLADGPLAGNTITAIRGILNGTTNYMLTAMEAGASYDDILKKAQDLGYAEADPTADVGGFDALAKVTILANVVMGENLIPDQIPCEGITGVTAEDIESAKSAGKNWKLIGEIKKTESGVEASVKPMQIESSHPLAGVSGANNAITFSTDLMGDVTMVGAGAGRIETGFSILNDILAIHRKES
jgi:homoserine dehydrogenase